MKTYEIPFRPIYEAYALLAWAAALLVMVGILKTAELPKGPFYIIFGGSLAMAGWRGAEALRRYQEKRNMTRGGLEFIEWDKFKKKANKDQGIFLGYGFPWGQEEVEKSTDVLKRDPVKLFGKKALNSGHQWIHGLGRHKDEDVSYPLELAAGHTLLVGTTGAGKTRMLDLLISQAILRNEAVFIIDPKGDKELRDNAQRICELMGQPDRFVFFHPAFPDQSARINPLRNWNRPTEIASRIATLIASESANDPFVAFGWMALNNIVNGILAIEEAPSLVMLRRYLEGDPGPLVMKALRAYFERKQVREWDSRIQPYLKKLRGRDTEAYIQFYQQEVVNEAPSSEMEGLISSFTHNREHSSKMLASLMPIMNMLTSGTMGPLLSPSSEDSDPRMVTDSARIINRSQVCYIGLDSLSDSTIGSAIGSILLADLTAVAGDRYNYGANNNRVNIYVDESSEVLNKPTIAMLNKGRGCGFNLTLATQTLADFAARLGDEAKARQVLGNMNNMVVLRVMDGETQKYIAENMPKTTVRTMEESYRSGSSSSSPGEFSGAYGEAIKEEEADLFPPSLLGLLPNLHFLAKFANGKTVKGRLPILQNKKTD